MSMCHFWAQNGPFAQTRIFSENLLINLVPFIHAYLHSKNQIQIIQSINEIMTIKRILKSHWSRAIFGHNLRTRFFLGMQFSQNVNGQ